MSRVAALVVLVANACAIPFDIPTARMPIERQHSGRHKHWVKGGVTLAEAKLAHCSLAHQLAGYGLGAFFVLPLGGFALAHADRQLFDDRWYGVSVLVGAIVGFFVGSAGLIIREEDMDDAVHAYNAAVP